MTELVCLKDSYLYELQGIVTKSKEKDGKKYVVLDKTVFYPNGGGQPTDVGTLSWGNNTVDVTFVVKDKGVVKHFIEGDLPSEGTSVIEKVDEVRRSLHRSMHTASHIVSRLTLDKFGSECVGNQVGAEVSRMDLKPFKPTPEDLVQLKKDFDAAVDTDVDVNITEMPRETVKELVHPSHMKFIDNLNPNLTTLRVIDIPGIDLDPCGGTHVRNTREIGHIEFLKKSNKGSGITRLSFKLVSR